MVLVAIAACSPGSGSDAGWEGPSRTADEWLDELPSLRPNPEPRAPLGWELSLVSREPLTLTVEVVGPAGRESHGPFDADGPFAAWFHGFRAGESHQLVVTAVDAGGESRSWELPVEAPALPANFPDVRLAHADPAAMEPGVTVLAPNDEGVSTPTYIAAFDASGHVVWWYEAEGAIHRIEQLPDGRVRYLHNQDAVVEVDLRGTVGTVLHPELGPSSYGGATQVATPVLHHDVLRLPEGTLLGLSVEARELERYPANEESPQVLEPALVAGDVIVEIEPQSGAVLREWRLLDLLDTERVGWDAVTGNFWEPLLGDDVADWSHANALQYDAANDRIWVSLRHQDAIVAIGRSSGAVEAILAPSEGWSAPFLDLLLDGLAPSDAAYHQHGIHLAADGSIFAFDNGNYRTTPPTEPSEPTASRAVQYAVDVASGAAALVWSWEAPGAHFSGSLGNAQWLAERDNVLVVYGNIAEASDDEPGVRVYEVSRATDTVVFELHVYSQPGSGVTTSRASRWPKLQLSY